MSRKVKIIILILAIAAILAVVFILMFRSGQKSSVPNLDETASPQKVHLKDGEIVAIQLPPATEDEKQVISAKNMAVSFVERFGTFTNQSNYIGLLELSPALSSPMQSWLKNTYIPQLKTQHDPNGFFYRVITRAPAAELVSQTDSKIKMKVSTEREETLSETEPVVFMQDIVVDLVKENNNWLVDGAFWQTKK
ncbi:hypothetical protein KKC32_03760 [Patescibacteria group bacterium]|nr:hypothetical protein [Patescibacteria group bacterium]